MRKRKSSFLSTVGPGRHAVFLRYSSHPPEASGQTRSLCVTPPCDMKGTCSTAGGGDSRGNNHAGQPPSTTCQRDVRTHHPPGVSETLVTAQVFLDRERLSSSHVRMPDVGHQKSNALRVRILSSPNTIVVGVYVFCRTPECTMTIALTISPKAPYSLIR